MEQDFKTNINCGSCVKAVTPRLQQIDGLISWNVDTDNPDKVLHVAMATDVSAAIVAAVQKAGFQIQAI
jgi:copper chaperone CopZ